MTKHGSESPKTSLKLTIAALSLGVALPAFVVSAQADCLSDVQALRTAIETGKVATLDLDENDAKKTKTSENSANETDGAKMSDTSAAVKTDAGNNLPGVSSSAEASATAEQPTITGSVSSSSTMGDTPGSDAAALRDGKDGMDPEKSTDAEGDVQIKTAKGEVTVPVGDGQPRENWFGRSPDEQTAMEYLDAAEFAVKDNNDTDACYEQLANARSSLSAETKAD